MNHYAIMEMVEPWKVLDQRKNKRFQGAGHILSITNKGTGQIIDLGREGLAFGVLYPHTFPDSWLIDILDARGTHIKKLQVKKIWERNIDHQNHSANFVLEIGVEFVDITPLQADQLEYLLDNLGLDFIEMQVPYLL